MSSHSALRRAAALIDLGRPQEALEHLRRVYAEAADDPHLHFLMGFACLHLGDYAQALASGRDAVTRAPEHVEGHWVCALALLGLGRPKDARQAAMEAARFGPEDSVPHLVLADALQAVGDHAGAVAAARHAIALDPEDAQTHAKLGAVLLEQDRPTEAIRAYERAIALEPQNPVYLNDLAVARLRAHQGGTGKQFEAALRLDPRYETARYNLLYTGAAGRTFACRRWSVGSALMALLMLPTAGIDPDPLVTFSLAVLAFELVRLIEVTGLSAPTRQLLADDRRARRFKPRRWDWSWLPSARLGWRRLRALGCRGVYRRRQERRGGSWRPPA